MIGGGGAATAAALAAHEAGSRVLLAVKGRFGVPGGRGAGATSNPIADFWTIRTVGPKGGLFNTPDAVHADMLQTGLGMADPVLCRVFVDEIGDTLRRLDDMGLRFRSKMLATLSANSAAGGTNGIVATQKALIHDADIPVLEQANVVDLIVSGGRCVGALGVDDLGEPFVIEAGAVVLATGGVGQLFQWSFNPPGNTGDGYAMALRAGAELFNMEFMQQGLATTWPTQAIVMLYEVDEPYRLVNASGRSFVESYLPSGVELRAVTRSKSHHWPVSCRDESIHLDRAIKAEALAGRATANDAVLLDLSAVDRGFEPELFVKFMLSKGIDVKRDLVHVQVHHHTSNGGVRVDADGETRVAGLFATGETIGWQGADRLGGTMLGGSQVFGRRAGAKAARASAARPAVTLGAAAADPLIDRIRCLREASGRVRPSELRLGLQRTLWETLLVEKDVESLARARSFLAEDRDRLEADVAITEPGDLVLALEQRNLHDVAEAIVEAASARTESRGSHYRSDYPRRDDANWMTNLFASHVNGELSLRREWVAREHGWTDRPGDVRIKPWG
ncbi:MAG: FAD-binding protein [Planctomycetes bacterium]|nr:FAD-binding protein [Planctomycetota bacterium]MBI3843470.1 FAD-binding protein [Planctomycetota bacterium]